MITENPGFDSKMSSLQGISKFWVIIRGHFYGQNLNFDVQIQHVLIFDFFSILDEEKFLDLQVLESPPLSTKIVILDQKIN